MAGSGSAMLIEERTLYRALTFDCYGTLVDWRGGLLAGLDRCPALAGIEWDEAVFLGDRMEEEARLEAESWRPYREIVALSLQSALARQGIVLPDPEAVEVAEGIGTWPPFADTCEALKLLGQGRRLCLVSNVDAVDLRKTVKQLGVEFATLVTAEDVRAYKPAPAHFHEVLRRLELPPGQVLHVAQSLYHDVNPVADLGLDAAWINRLGETLPEGTTPRFQFSDLAGLARQLGPVHGDEA
jgi:2-haloacid dehalogenase